MSANYIFILMWSKTWTCDSFKCISFLNYVENKIWSTNQSYSNTSFYTNTIVWCISFLNHVENKVQLQTIITKILALLISHVFIFTEIFISPYSLKLLSSIFSFSLSGFPWVFIEGQVWWSQTSLTSYLGGFNFFLTFEGQRC